jgi:hypothetical protein
MDKLEWLSESKEREKQQEAMHLEDTQGLVREPNAEIVFNELKLLSAIIIIFI